MTWRVDTEAIHADCRGPAESIHTITMANSVAPVRVCPACGARYTTEDRFCAADGQVLHDEAAGDSGLVGSIVAERYYVECQLEDNAAFVVYRARHVSMARRYALKVPPRDLLHSPDARAQLTRGLQQAAGLIHPNIAAVRDFGEIGDGSMYVAMEFIEGETVGRVVEQSGPLSVARTARIVDQVAAALHAAHEAAVVHGALTPDAVVMVGDAGLDDHVKVLDFAIAPLITAGPVRGSAPPLEKTAYMSPEELSEGKIASSADSYAPAVTTCLMLTGRLPFDPADTIAGRRHPKRLRDLDPATPWPEDVQRALNRALSLRESDRPDVNEFAHELISAAQRWNPSAIVPSLMSTTRSNSVSTPPRRSVRALLRRAFRLKSD